MQPEGHATYGSKIVGAGAAVVGGAFVVVVTFRLRKRISYPLSAAQTLSPCLLRYLAKFCSYCFPDFSFSEDEIL
jgi:hypothetical protein